jgi:hypothetical protein
MPPTETLGMPFLAARIGPGHEVPRASTIFSAWMELRSSDMVLSFGMTLVLVFLFASSSLMNCRSLGPYRVSVV